MKSKIKFMIVFSLALSLVFFPSCKRKALEEPTLFGPSSLSILLTLSANPNVLFAGDTRGTTKITASLKKYDGTPLANRTIYFEVRNAGGNKVNLGYFEGNQAVDSKATDGNGLVTVNYYGPLGKELTNNATIYIYAQVAWQGIESLSESCPIYVIQDVTQIKFELSAQPNVQVAGETRESSTITATLKTAGGAPLANQTIHFEIHDENGSQVNIGYFEGNELVITKETDQNGQVTVTYYGPLASELTESTTVYIAATATRDGEAYLSTTASIYIIRDVTEAVLELTAEPNVLFANETRESSTLNATLKTAGGAPLANQTIHFEIHDENGSQVNIGYFEGNELVITKETDQNGQVAVTYYGPLASELTESTTVYIAATATRDGEAYLSTTASIYIIRNVTEATLELTADPNVLFANETRESSTLNATLKTAGGAPLANQTIHLEIHDENGSQVNIGYFEGNELVITKETDQNGQVTVTYYGPLAEELTESTTIYIAATATRDGEAYLSTTASIYIIRDVTEATLEVTADPNVLFAKESRELSTITATLKTAGGAPLANQTIFLEIHDENGSQVNIGYFQGDQLVITKETDQNGQVTVTYYGPLASELTESTTIYIAATATRDGEAYLTATASIYIIRDVTEAVLEFTAIPKVLIARETDNASTITATLKTAGGAPLANQTTFLEIHDKDGKPGEH